MIDFLRANTWCSQEEYKWGMTVAQVRLSSFDYSRVEYLKDKKNGSADKNKGLSRSDVLDSSKNMLADMTDFGGPIINK